MLTVSLLFLGILLACLALLVPALARLFQKCAVNEVTPEWLENFNPADYRPMHDLLASEDFQFLARQPGFDLSLYRKLRRERMLIFRQYLRRLIADFNRLHAYARLVISHSEQDQSELALRLARLKVQFAFSVLRAELSYYFCLVGIGSLASHAVVEQLEMMTAHLGLQQHAVA